MLSRDGIRVLGQCDTDPSPDLVGPGLGVRDSRHGGLELKLTQTGLGLRNLDSASFNNKKTSRLTSEVS